ncbi:Polyamine aminopropyltransferase [subsurface metagenome]
MSTKKENREVDPSEEREYHSPSSGIFFKLKRLLYRDKSDYQKIEVIENEYFGRVLLLDDLVQTSERDEFFYHEMLVHPQSILVIGGGDGGALKELKSVKAKWVFIPEIHYNI